MFRKFIVPLTVVLVLAVGLGAVAVSAMPSAPVSPELAPAAPGGPPLTGASDLSFKVQIDGIPAAAFEAVQVGSEVEVIEFRPGGDPVPPIKIPGDASYPNVVLVARPDNPALQPLWEWHDAIAGGAVDKRDGTIIVQQKNGTEVARYKFFDSFPSKWEVSGLPTVLDPAMEVIELAVERVERE